MKSQLRTTTNEFHPLELENTMTSISITASQNLRKSVIQPALMPIEKETNKIAAPEKPKEYQDKDKPSHKVNKILKSIKKNMSNKILPIVKKFDSAKKSEILNDSLDSKTHTSTKKGSIIAKIKLNSTYSSKNLNKNKSTDKSMDNKISNQSDVKNQKKQKEMRRNHLNKISL